MYTSASVPVEVMKDGRRDDERSDTGLGPIPVRPATRTCSIGLLTACQSYFHFLGGH